MYFDHYGVLRGIGHFRGFGDILVILEVWRYFNHFEGFTALGGYVGHFKSFMGIWAF